MALVKEIAKIATYMPAIKIDVKRLQHIFLNLHIPIEAERYVTLCIFLILFSAIFTYLNFYAGMLFFLFSIFIYALPFIEFESVKREIESEMPLFLRQLGSLMKIGIPFSNALELATREGAVSIYFKPVIKEIKQGVAVQKALYDFSSRFGTDTTKRAIAQIISSYQHGGGEELKRLGDEMLNMQRHKLKDYAAKSSMLALFFIIFTIIAPVLYIISTILSGTIENSSADNVFNAILIIDILVPAFSFFIILLAVAFFPPVMFANKGMSIITLLPASILALLFFFNIDFQLKFLAIIIFFAISSFYFIKEYRERKEIEEIENSLGDGLLMASSLPKGAHIKDFFYSMCKHAKGRLSTEFCIAHKQIINLVSIDKVMHDLKTRIKSELFEKTMEILEYSFKTGKHVTEKLAELAEDILNFSELKRERISMLSIQKYSLIIGALLIPIILSSAFSIISGLDIIDENFLTLLRFSIVPAYLIMISSLSAIFISTMESNRTAELIYFSFFTITEIFIYFNTNISI